MGGGPGLGIAAARRVEGVRGLPYVFRDMNEVDQDADLDVAACGFGVDEVELVAGAVRIPTTRRSAPANGDASTAVGGSPPGRSKTPAGILARSSPAVSR